MGYFSPGCITVVTYAECLTCPGEGYVRGKRSVVIAHQSDQSVPLKNDITIQKRSRGAQSVDHESVSEEEKNVYRLMNLFKFTVSDDFYKYRF